MNQDTPPKLPPMTALEFAVDKTFRHFFFGLRLALCWALIAAPFAAGAYFHAVKDGLPDPANLSPVATAIAIALGFVTLFATVSIAVNWHRRILLDERPKGLGWVRLNGPVWHYLAVLLVVVIAVGVIAGLAGLAVLHLPARLEPHIGGAAVPAAQVVAGLLGFVALMTWYRLSTKLPAAAIGRKEYRAWRATRGNTMRFIGFTFWLAFTLAIAGAMAAGAFFAAQSLPQFPWVAPVAIAFTGVLLWLALFLNTTVATSLYYYFSGGTEIAA